MKKKSVFHGKISLYNGLVFGTLENGDTVIIANSVADAKQLIGAEIEYQKISKSGDPLRFKVVGIQL